MITYDEMTQWLEIPESIHTAASQQGQVILGLGDRWQAYLNQICSDTMRQWLQEKYPQLPQAKVTFLIEPNRLQFSEQLWEQTSELGFSHAPAAKRKLMQSNVSFITVEGTLGCGLLAAVALNAIAESLIEKPDCHCHLESSSS